MAKKLTTLAGMCGNAVEWYDFTIYAFFAPIIAHLFFPTADHFMSLLATFSVFALGFLVRPLGGILFGYIGDHFGRKKALILSILLMTIPTFLLTILPPYQSIGVIAPILLTILRLLQGTAVSGELTTTISFLVEHAPSHKRGLAGSLAMCSAFIGIVSSSAIATLITHLLTDSEVHQLGWRIAFAIGGGLGLIGLYLRLKSHESPAFEQTRHQLTEQKCSMLKHFISLDWRSVTFSAVLTAIMAVGNYFLIAYIHTFLSKNLNLPIKQVMLINFISLTVMTFLLPVIGTISDKIGRKIVLGTGMSLCVFLIYPIFWLFMQRNIITAFIGELLLVVAIAPIAALIPTTLAELFEARSRNSSLAIGYNLSLALFGGTAPLVAMSLIQHTQNFYAPAGYFFVISLCSFFALLKIQESYRIVLK